MRTSSWIAVGMLSAVTLWMASGLFIGGGDEGEEGNEQQESAQSQPTLVGARTSRAETIPTYVYAQGVAQPFRTNDVFAETGSVVDRIDIQQGDRVAVGDELAHLKLEARASRLESAEARVSQLAADADAISQLVRDGFATPSRLRDLRSQLENARATLAEVREQVEDTAVRAPISGTVSELYVNENQSLSAGAAIMRIVNNSPLRVMVAVSQRKVGRINRGDPAIVQFVVGDTAKGRVCFVAPAADPETRTFRVEIRIPNDDGAIPSNISTEVRLRTGEEKAHFVSPAVLALDDSGRLGLKSVTSEREVEFIPVDIVRSERDGFWITGPPEEFRLIHRGQGFVRQGEKVRLGNDDGGKPSGTSGHGEPAEAPLPTATTRDDRFREAESLPEAPAADELCKEVAANVSSDGSGMTVMQRQSRRQGPAAWDFSRGTSAVSNERAGGQPGELERDPESLSGEIAPLPAEQRRPAPAPETSP